MISPAGGPSRSIASKVIPFPTIPGVTTLFAIAFLLEEGPAVETLATGASLLERERVTTCDARVGPAYDGAGGGGGSLRAKETVRFCGCHRWSGGTGGASDSGGLEERVCAD
jgi:hypothetical protein